MTTLISHPIHHTLRGTTLVPGDKSIGHRSLIVSALSESVVTIHGLSAGEDNLRTRQALRALGVTIDTTSTNTTLVHGVGKNGLQNSRDPIDCGNSGTTMRLLAGVVSAQPIQTVLFGDESLTQRPMMRIVQPLREMQATIDGITASDTVFPPLTITGNTQLVPIRWQSPVASAQVKSCILLAAFCAGVEASVIEPSLSRDHTERMLRFCGALVDSSHHTATIRPSHQPLLVDTLHVPGDISSAAFVLAAGLVCGTDQVTIENVGVNPTRTGVLEAIGDFGHGIHRTHPIDRNAEPMAHLHVDNATPGSLPAIRIDGHTTSRCIDELPILSVVAAQAQGKTTIRDAQELRVKESDRIAQTCSMLQKLGVSVKEFPDGYDIQGLAGKRFRGAHIECQGDHRIAMSAAIAGMYADAPVIIEGAQTIATSFPSFTQTMNSLGASMQWTDGKNTT